MAQLELVDLLDDDDDDEVASLGPQNSQRKNVYVEKWLKATVPSGSVDFEALLRSEGGHQSRQNNSQVAAQSASTPGPSQQVGQSSAIQQHPRAEQGGTAKTALPVALLLEWCKANLPPNDRARIYQDIQRKVAQGNRSPKEVYSTMLTMLGPERMKLVKAYMVSEVQKRTGGQIARPSSGQLTPTAQPNPGQLSVGSQVRPAVAGGQVAGGSSIMQSLKYNAEQSRQPPAQPQAAPRPWAPPPQPQLLPRPPLQVSQAMPAHFQPQQQPAKVADPRPLISPSPPTSSGLYGHMNQRPSQPAQTKVVADPAAAPQAKKAKKDKEDDLEYDVLQDSGVNLEEEQSALLGTLERGTISQRARPSVPEETFLNLNPLGVKVLGIAKRHGLESIDQQTLQLLSRALDSHLGSLVQKTFLMTRQRDDADRSRPGMVLTANIRKRLHELNVKQRERMEAREKKELEVLAAQTTGTKRKHQDEELSKRAEKASRKESEKQQASAANAAAAAAFGSKAQKWGSWSTAAAKKPASAGATKSDNTNAATAARPPSASKEASTRKDNNARLKNPSYLPPSRVKAEMLSAKLPDLIAVLERDPVYQRSTLLYKLYEQVDD